MGKSAEAGKGTKSAKGVARRARVTLPELRPYEDGRLESEGDYDGLEFADVDLGGQSARGARFLDCGLRRCGLDETRLGRARFIDCVLEEVRGVGTDLAEAQLRDVEMADARLGGAQLHGSVLERVLVRGGKIDYPNFREARLKDVVFEGCVLIEADWGGAVLERVAFVDCVLRGADLTGATMTDVDLRGATELDIARGVERLAGAVISPVQLMELAPVFAQRLGVRVEAPGD